MSNTIGFTNFRKFTNFPEIDLGDITILVGGNNAGKSTLVKAMLLMRDFLKSRINSSDINSYNLGYFTPRFSFDTEHVNVGDFYRAFCRQSPEKEDSISFKMRIYKFRFLVVLRGERKPGAIPQVTMISVSDEDSDIHFTFNFTKGIMAVRFEYDREALNNDIHTLHEHMLQLNALKEKLSKSRDLNEISILKMGIEQEEKIINSCKTDTEISEYEEVSIPMYLFSDNNNIGKMLLPELINGFSEYAWSGTTGNKRSASYKKEEANKNFLRGKEMEILRVSEELEDFLNKQDIEYIYAHSVYQDSVYANCANSSDYTKRTIHEFYTSRISKGDEEFALMEKWLKEFNIGKSLKVVPFKGDNYTLTIFDNDNSDAINKNENDNSNGIDLADKGMGSIQVVILLLRIATLIRKYKGQNLTILLKEPEQNLHPVLQSKLADLIFEVNKNFGLRFVIETHSEYLVRHSQVIAASQMYEEGIALSEVNESIKVLYISQERGVVDMLFSNNAKFQDYFDEGFFDQAARESFTISRLERINKNK